MLKGPSLAHRRLGEWLSEWFARWREVLLVVDGNLDALLFRWRSVDIRVAKNARYDDAKIFLQYLDNVVPTRVSSSNIS